MADKEQQKSSKQGQKDRLSQALRANLRRRKEQARARDSQDEDKSAQD
jgi:hypothetical protein